MDFWLQSLDGSISEPSQEAGIVHPLMMGSQLKTPAVLLGQRRSRNASVS